MSAIVQPSGRSPGLFAQLGRVLASEVIKAGSVKSTVLMPIAILVGIIGIAVFVGATESLQPDDTILGGALTGAVPAQIVAGAFGVIVVAGEFGTGLVRTTFSAMPRRGMVLAAKTIVVAVPMFLVGLVGSGIAYAIGTEMLSGRGYASGEAMPALVGVALSFSAVGLLGLAIGAILQHSGGGIAAVFGITMLPDLLAPLFGSMERWVAGASPTAALQKMAQSSDALPEIAGSIGAWPSLAIICAYATAGLWLAAALVRRRDV
jgi:ABC-2 type transport system permease protein